MTKTPVDIETCPTDVAVAHKVAADNRDRLRWVVEQKRWYSFDGNIWRPDDCAVSDAIVNECVLLVSRTDNPRWGSDAAITAVERRMRMIRYLRVSINDFDADPWLLGTPEGVVDLRTGRLRPGRPEDMISRSTAVAPDFEGEPPVWCRFIRDVTCGDRGLADHLHRMFGYMLTGWTSEQCFWLLYGVGANGKTTFVDTLAGIMGEYHKVAAENVFVQLRYDDHPAGLADLAGARLVTDSEVAAGQRWNVRRIKSFTGGDKIKARFMHADFFEYRPVGKILISGNFKPDLDAVDDAIARRMRVVPFRARFTEPDRTMPQQLREEWSRILAWGIRGCLAWQSDGLRVPEAVAIETKEYLDEQNLIERWMEERCEVDRDTTGTGYRCLSSKLYASWAAWCREQGEDPGSNKRFSMELSKRGFRKQHGASGREFFGIRVRPDAVRPITD